MNVAVAIRNVACVQCLVMPLAVAFVSPEQGFGAAAHHPKRAFRLESIPTVLDTVTSGLASICRLPKGVTVSPTAASTNDAEIRLVKLYDIENSVPCRVVRERITELDLVVEKVIPAADNSRAMVDTSSDDFLPPGMELPCLRVAMSDGSMDTLTGETTIVDFLNQNFDATPPETSQQETELSPSTVRDGLIQGLQAAGSVVASLLRTGRGCRVSPAVSSAPQPNQKPLILYSYEGNQFCRLVREVLTELDLVYQLQSAGKESPRRNELAARTGGSSQCPYLIDPNTNVEMAESKDIIAYLYDTYAEWTPPPEILEWTSKVVMETLFQPVFSLLAPLQAGSKSLEGDEYQIAIGKAKAEIETETKSSPVVIYTYAWSPFSSETKLLLDRLQIDYKELSLGQEWIPGLIAPGGAAKRAALLEVTGQSSLPHIFVGGESLGGLFSGRPGLVPSLQEGTFRRRVSAASATTATVV